MDWDDEIDNLFEQFIEEINDMPFNTDYENTPDFLLNQSIINNAYLLRRTIELYPQEQRYTSRLRRQGIVPNNTPRNTPGSTPSNINNNIGRYNGNDTINVINTREFSHIWNPLDIQLTSNNLTDSILTSLFTNFNEFMEQNLNDLEDVKVTLSQNEFDNLDTVKDKELVENKQCNICLEDLKVEDIDNKSLIELKCQHIYHNDCIKEWLLKQSTKCPTCRTCCRTSTNSE
jgi:hypothetical protein